MRSPGAAMSGLSRPSAAGPMDEKAAMLVALKSGIADCAATRIDTSPGSDALAIPSSAAPSLCPICPHTPPQPPPTHTHTLSRARERPETAAPHLLDPRPPTPPCSHLPSAPSPRSASLRLGGTPPSPHQRTPRPCSLRYLKYQLIRVIYIRVIYIPIYIRVVSPSEPSPTRLETRPLPSLAHDPTLQAYPSRSPSTRIKRLAARARARV
jgi:hypothetical protein